MCEIGDIIGTGRYSIVNEIIHPFTGARYALKETIPNFIEIDILKRFAHPNIISLITFWLDEKCNTDNDSKYSLYIMTELGQFTIQNCNDYINRSDLYSLVIDMITAVYFLHCNGVIHCDINPSNFVIVSTAKGNVVKLIDFGMSTYRDNPGYNCQTLIYAPPEVLSLYYDLHIRGAGNHVSNMATDLWALAGTIIYCFSKLPPFGTTRDEIKSNLREYYRYPRLYLIGKRIPNIWQKTVILLLELDPIKRLYNMQEVVTYHNITVPIISQQPPIIDNTQLAKCDPDITTGSNLLLHISEHYNFDVEITFLAFDLYYRVLSLPDIKVSISHIVPACVFLAYQLGTLWDNIIPGEFDITPLHILSEYFPDSNNIIKVAGMIANKLEGELYTPNLFTGVFDPVILSHNLMSLKSWRKYISHRPYIKFPTLRKLRIPMTLLI